MKRLYGIAGDGRASRHLQRYFGLLKIPYKVWHRRSGSTPEAVLAPCSTVFLLLSDSAIAPFITAQPFLKDKKLIHFSGSLSIAGAAAMHPFMPLAPRRLTLAQYRAIPFALEPGVSLKKLVPEFTNPSFCVRPQDKPLYHALCVIGANLPVLLWNRAQSGLSAFGVPPAAAAAYFRASLDNFIASPARALTGPIARGDAATVNSNIKALGRDPYAKVYRAFNQAYLRGKDKQNPVGGRRLRKRGGRDGEGRARCARPCFCVPSPAGRPRSKDITHENN